MRQQTKEELLRALEEAQARIGYLETQLAEARSWATRHVTLTDRLLNVLEYRAKEGNV